MANEHMAHLYKKLIALVIKVPIMVPFIGTVPLYQILAQQQGMALVDIRRISVLVFPSDHCLFPSIISLKKEHQLKCE